jgi:oligopeptide/dipeptide ABC transporter ATP-binding protein
VALLEVSDLRTWFRTRRGVVRAVDGVSLSVERGRTLGIVGESGCGKSVTALSLIRLLPSAASIESGSVTFDGRDLATLGRRELEELRGRDIGMIFQDPMTSLNPTNTVGAQIIETLRRHEDINRADATRRARELLEEVQIPSADDRLRDYPHQFSGGMRQRVMIAIAIACRPKLLIADEPTTAVDVTVQGQILELLDGLRQAHNMAMLLITHDVGVIADVAHDVVVMYAGQVVEQASTFELFDHPEHPYTEALLRAVPRADSTEARRGRLEAIVGRPPLLIDPPAGCRFAPRCPHSGLDDCASEPQALRAIRPGHLVRTSHPASERSAAPVT